MANVNLNTVELVTTLRTAPMNGAPSSTDYNEGQREMLVDLAALAGFINDTLLPLLDALPDSALLPVEAPIGIEGRTIWADTSDQGPTFFNALSNTPLTVADAIRHVTGILNTNSQKLTDLGIEVASLQARLSSTNQNDIALALQNLTISLNGLIADSIDSNGSIGAIQDRISALETDENTTHDSLSTLQAFDVTADSRITALENGDTNVVIPCDIPFFYNTTGITNGLLLLRMNAVRTFTFPAAFVGSIATAIIGPAGSVDIAIRKNGSFIGNISFSTGALTGTFTGPSSVTFVAGDYIDLVSTTNDASVSKIAITLFGTYAGTASLPPDTSEIEMIVIKTADYSVLASDSGTFFTNTGATTGITFVLPLGTLGLKYTYYIDNVQSVSVSATGGAKIRYLSTLSSANGTISAATQGNKVSLVCIGVSGPDAVVEWVVDTIFGTWTVT